MSDPNQNPAPGATGDTARLERPATKSKRVLLVEGDGFLRLVLLFLLKMAGLHVDFTSNGTIALRKLRARHPDALLVELNLRGLSGLDLIRTARRDLEFGSRPIYVYTPVDLMNRSTRKEVAKLATRVFDKRSMAMENLVKTVAGMLADPEAAAAARQGSKTKDAIAERAVEIPIPREVEEIIAAVRTQSKLFVKSRNEAARKECCTELLSRVCALASCVEAAGLRNLARQAKVLEAFLNQLCKEKQQYFEAAFNTVNRAVEVMSSLYRGAAGKKRELSQITAVIVDEAAPSNMAVSDSLRNAGIHPIAFEAPASALDHLKSNPADVIIANVLLPEMHGLTLSEIKQLPLHTATPVIFVPELATTDHSHKDKDKELPTSAPRLNSNPLLLKEVTMKALNEAQSPHLPPPAPAASNLPEPDAILEDEDTLTEEPVPVARASTAVNRQALPPEDGFNLFGVPNTQTAGRPLAAAQESFTATPGSRAAASQPESWAAGGKPANGNGKPTVLFIEDDPFVVRVYTRSLNREGFRVEVAEDGVAALEVLPSVRPDVVVLDLMLPKLHGLEVLKFIRADVNLKSTPVLVLSNAYLEGLAAKANQAGANKGLLKTECSPQKLVQHIYELLGRTMPARPAAPGLREIEEAAMLEEAAAHDDTTILTRQAGLRKDAPKEVVQLRQVCLAYIKTNAPEDRLSYLTELYRRVRFLSARAGLSGLTKIAELCSALEGLLFQIVFKQTEPTSSTFQTIAQAVDCLDRLAQNHDTTFNEPRAKAKVLVVDDDPVCNFGMVNALKRASFEAVGVADPVDSLRVLKSTLFDLVLLDINMPQLSGFEVCEHLRRMPEYGAVPVIFVTIDAEFQNRARSVVAGGNDLMAKPVFPLELIVKVTMHLLNSTPKAGSPPAGAPTPSLALANEAVPDEQAVLTADVEQAPTAEPVAPALDAAGIPFELFQRAEPGQTGGEGQAEDITMLPETSSDNLQADERPLEILQPTGLQPEATDVPQLEPTIEEQLAGAERLATSEGNSGEPVPMATDGVEPLSNAAPSEPADLAQPGQPEEENPFAAAAGDDPQQALERYKTERDTLALRICNTEMDLSRAQARIERRDKTIEELKQELVQLKALNPSTAPTSSHVPGQPDTLPAGLPPAGGGGALAENLAQARCAQLEVEMATLLQSRAELEARLALEQKVTSDSTKRTQDLEQRLAQGASDLERARLELEQQQQQQQLTESELRRQLDAAGLATTANEATRKEAQVRCEQMEEELAALREARDQLNSKLGLEQQVTVDSARRTQELEQRLAQSGTELERLQSELQRQQQHQAGVESELRRQLEAALLATRDSEEAQKQDGARRAQLEQELAALRQAREELDAKFAREQQTAAESARRAQEFEQRSGQGATELELARAELTRQKEELERAESELRRQLDAAAAASRENEAAHQQAEARAAQLEQELAALRQTSAELDTKFAHEHQVAAESAKRAQELIRLLDQSASELRRTQADLESQTQFRTRLEVELRAQLDAATAALRQTEAAHKQTQAHAEKVGQELAALRQAREELGAKFDQEQQVGAESTKRAQELEQRLSQSAVELQRAQADLQTQIQERRRVEAELGRQLEAASQQADAAAKQAQGRSEQLERELALERQGREELHGKFMREQLTSSEAGDRVKDLEHQLNQRATELERAKADFEKELQERSSAESKLREQHDAASALASRTEDAHKRAQTRCGELEKELASLAEARKQLNAKFVQQHQRSRKAAKRLEELEAALQQGGAELERTKAGSEAQGKERVRVESELRQQLTAASTALKQSEAAQQQAGVRFGQLEQELAGLREAREQLAGKFEKEQQVTAASGAQVRELQGQLDSKSVELERARAELDAQANERGRVESELRKQLETAGAALKQREAAQEQAMARGGQLEQELAAVSRAREQLAGKFEKEQQVTAASGARVKELQGQLDSKSVELERARAELDAQASERGGVESELRKQLETAGAALKQREAAQEQAVARGGQLEQELAAVSQAREQLAGKFEKEQQVTAASAAQVRELQGQLDSKSTDLDRVRAELDTQNKERSRVESELRKQLETAGAALKQSETAQQQAAARGGQLEQELAAVRQVREELAGKFEKEQQVTAASGARVKELQGQLDSKSADLDRARAELDAQAKDRTRVESDLRKQLEAGQQQAGVRFGQLEQELAGLREAREQLIGQFTKEQQLTTESAARIKELQSQLTSKSAELARVNVESEKQVDERRRTESDLRKQLETASAALKQSEATQQQAQARGGQLEQELVALRQAREEVAGKFDKELQAGAKFRARVKELENQLASDANLLGRAKIELEKQIKERSRVESDLRRQLDAASVTIKQTDAARQQTGARLSQLEQEIAAVRQAREELAARFGKEQQVAAESRARISELEAQLGSKAVELAQSKADSEKQAEQHGSIESELRRQIAAASANLTQNEAAHAQTRSQVAKLEQDLAAQRQAGEDLAGKLGNEQQATTEARTQVKALEQQLQATEAARGAQISELDQRVRQGVAALARASADLSQEQGQRQRSEQRAASLSTRLQELHEEFGRTLQAQRANLERITSLEEQLRQSEQNLTRRTAESEQQQAGRKLAEEQLQKAKELNIQFRKNLAYYEEASRIFDRTRHDLEAKLDASLNAGRETEGRLVRETAERQRLAETLEGVRRELQEQSRKREHLESDLENTLKTLNETGVKLQKEAGERQRLAEVLDGLQRELQAQSRKRETLETELQTTAGVMHEIETRLQNEAAERQRLAEVLQGVQRELQTELRKSEAFQQELRSALDAAREREAKLVSGAAERQRLAEALDGSQRDFEAQSRKREALERELKTTLDVLHDSEAKLQQEVAARQRLNEALDAAELALRERSQRSELEFSRIHSDLQLERAERKRQETHMARMRHISLDAVRASRIMRNSLRQQLHETLDQLYQSARSLLELETNGEQKRLAEAVMHDVLLVRARLREPEMGQSSPPPGNPDSAVAP